MKGKQAENIEKSWGAGKQLRKWESKKKERLIKEGIECF